MAGGVWLWAGAGVRPAADVGAGLRSDVAAGLAAADAGIWLGPDISGHPHGIVVALAEVLEAQAVPGGKEQLPAL